MADRSSISACSGFRSGTWLQSIESATGTLPLQRAGQLPLQLVDRLDLAPPPVTDGCDVAGPATWAKTGILGREQVGALGLVPLAPFLLGRPLEVRPGGLILFSHRPGPRPRWPRARGERPCCP